MNYWHIAWDPRDSSMISTLYWITLCLTVTLDLLIVISMLCFCLPTLNYRRTKDCNQNFSPGESGNCSTEEDRRSIQQKWLYNWWKLFTKQHWCKPSVECWKYYIFCSPKLSIEHGILYSYYLRKTLLYDFLFCSFKLCIVVFQ